MESGAKRFCQCAWEEFRPTARSVAHSDSVLARDQARHAIVSWALDLGVQWDDDDLMQMGFLAAHERHYADACGKGNTSFCRAYEKHQGRPPFLYAFETQTRQRLFVGAKFTYAGMNLEVTSFGADTEQYLNAICYPPNRHALRGAELMKGSKRLKLTVAMLRAAPEDQAQAKKRNGRDTAALIELIHKHDISMSGAQEIFKQLQEIRAKPHERHLCSIDGHRPWFKTPNVLVVGCRRIQWRVIMALARERGWSEENECLRGRG